MVIHYGDKENQVKFEESHFLLRHPVFPSLSNFPIYRESLAVYRDTLAVSGDGME